MIKTNYIKNLVKVIVITIIVGIIFYAIYYYAIDYNRKILLLPKKYCYSYIRGTLNPAFMVYDVDNLDKLTLFYEQVEDTTIEANLPYKSLMLPQFEPMYVLRYIQDSAFAEVYSYYEYGKLYRSHTKGYVSTHTLHDLPPSSEINIED